ncbi:MAG: hypothetical protein V4502_06095 [Pseudomonadota bacterium]
MNQAPHGILSDIGDTLKQYWHQVSPVAQAQGVADIALNPKAAVKGYGAQTEQLGHAAIDSFKKGEYSEGVRHALSYFLNGIPGIGAALDQAGNKAGTGDYKGAIADTAALATQIAEAKFGPKVLDAATEPGALAGPATAIADAAKTAARATGAGVKAAAPQVASGAAKVGGGAAVAAIPLPSWVKGGAEFELGRQGMRDIGRGLKTGYNAAKEAFEAAKAAREAPAPAAAAPEVIPPARQLGPGAILTPPPADTSGIIPGWKPTIIENGEPRTAAGPQPEQAPAEVPAAAPAGAAAAPPPPTPGEPGSVVELPLKDIHLDPVRFQFKQNVGARGVGDKLKDVSTWDPDMAGMTHVWRDPEDGQIYAVNGHHRVDLANRLDVPTMTARFLRADTAQEARTAGALINIGEGNGTALDAAKLFRESGMTPEDLESRGVSIKGELAGQGLALAKLDPYLFSKVVSGDIPMERGAIIGGGLENPADQRQLYDVLQKSEESGKRMTNDQVGEMIRLANGDQTAKFTETQHSLFGDEEVTRSLIKEKAEVSDYVRKRLSQERRLFETVGTERAASHLGTTGNVIVAGENAKVALQTSQSQLLYDKLSTSAGEVSTELNRAATALANGENANVIKARTYNAIKTKLLGEVKALTGGGRPSSVEPGGGSEVGPHPPGAGQPAEAAAASIAPPAPAANPAKAAFEKAKGPTGAKSDVPGAPDAAALPKSALVKYVDTVPKPVRAPEPETGGYSEEEMNARTLRYRAAEDQPPSVQHHAIGSWGEDSTGELMQLREYKLTDPRLQFPEGLPKNQTVAKYTDWINQGSKPPPLRGLETENGNIKIQEGHHRAAAIAATGGDTVPVWVTVTKNRPLGNGQVMPEGITYEQAQAAAPENPAKASFEKAKAERPPDFEGAARAKKVNALAETMWGEGEEPEISSEDAARLSPGDWNRLADGLGVNRPSPTSRAAVIEQLRSREAALDLNRASENTARMARARLYRGEGEPPAAAAGR